MTTTDLWSDEATDDDGTWELRVVPDDENPTDKLIIGVDSISVDGHREAVGLTLGRASVQQIRHAITRWLVDTAPLVGDP